MDNEELLRDVIASVIETVLMRIGATVHARVSDMLEVHSLKFSDCYQNPDVLNFALKEVLGYGYLEAVEKIKIEFGRLEYDDQNLARFLQKLGR